MGKKSKKQQDSEEDELVEETEELLDENLPADPRPPYNHCTDCFLAIDMYGVRPQLEMRGKRKVRSCCGACISFIAIICILFYTMIKTAYVLRNDGFIGETIVQIIEKELGLPFSDEILYLDGEEVDQEKVTYEDGEKDPMLTKRQFKIEWVGTSGTTYEQTLSFYEKKQSIILQILDAVSHIGGFGVFIYCFYGNFVRCINRKILLRNLIQDSLLAKNNNDFLGLEPPKPKKKPKKDKKKKDKEPPKGKKDKKSKKKAQLEEVEEEDDEDAESIGEGGELSQKYSHASIVSSIEKIRHGRNLSDCIDINDIEMMEIPSNTLYSEQEFEGGSSRKSTAHLNDDDSIEPDLKSARSQKSAKSKKSGAASQRSDADDKSTKSKKKDRSDSYKEKEQAPVEKKKERRNMEDFHKIDVSAFSLVMLGCLPSCCRTRYQKALGRLMKKADYKLHRELDIGPFLKNVRDGRNLVKSFSTSKVFDPDTLYTDYQTHYSNVVHISMNTDDSIEEELAPPIPVEYIDPKPTCVCPDLGQANLQSLAETAYGILKCETELTVKMEESIKARKLKSNQDKQSNKASTMEGGEGDGKSYAGISGLPPPSRQSAKSQAQNESDQKSMRPVILQPPESERDFAGKLEIVSHDEVHGALSKGKSMKQSRESGRLSPRSVGQIQKSQTPQGENKEQDVSEHKSANNIFSAPPVKNEDEQRPSNKESQKKDEVDQGADTPRIIPAPEEDKKDEKEDDEAEPVVIPPSKPKKNKDDKKDKKKKKDKDKEPKTDKKEKRSKSKKKDKKEKKEKKKDDKKEEDKPADKVEPVVAAEKADDEEEKKSEKPPKSLKSQQSKRSLSVKPPANPSDFKVDVASPAPSNMSLGSAKSNKSKISDKSKRSGISTTQKKKIGVDPYVKKKDD